MLVDAKIRRIAMMLEQMVDQKVVLIPAKDFKEHQVVTLESVDLLANVVRFGKPTMEMQFTVPLDMIESAYQAGPGWQVFMRGVVSDQHLNQDTLPQLRASKMFVPYS